MPPPATRNTNSAADNLRPIVPEHSPFDQTVLWFNGRYSSYTNFNTRIHAILSNDPTRQTSARLVSQGVVPAATKDLQTR